MEGHGGPKFKPNLRCDCQKLPRLCLILIGAVHSTTSTAYIGAREIESKSPIKYKRAIKLITVDKKAENQLNGRQ